MREGARTIKSDEGVGASDGHHRALAALVTEHRDQLEAYADSDKETAWLSRAVLAWDRADARDRREGRP